MHTLTDKNCPLFRQTCLLNGCTFFSERLDGCEISIMNYNLYQLKEHIRALLDQVQLLGQPARPEMPATPNGRKYPRPIR